jgi:hypothetical protein
VNQGIATVQVFDPFWNLDDSGDTESLAGHG